MTATDPGEGPTGTPSPKAPVPRGCLWGALALLIAFGAYWASIGDGSTQSADADRETYEALGLEWPLTVESGTLNCSGGAVTFETEGKRYAVNGTARGTGKYPDIAPIWAPAPGGLGLKKNIGDLIDVGLRLCG